MPKVYFDTALAYGPLELNQLHMALCLVGNGPLGTFLAYVRKFLIIRVDFFTK